MTMQTETSQSPTSPPTNSDDLAPFSFSGLDTWTTCQEKFRITRELKVESDPAVWLAAGSGFHHGCDVIDRLLLADEEPPF